MHPAHGCPAGTAGGQPLRVAWARPLDAFPRATPRGQRGPVALERDLERTDKKTKRPAASPLPKKPTNHITARQGGASAGDALLFRGVLTGRRNLGVMIVCQLVAEARREDAAVPESA